MLIKVVLSAVLLWYGSAIADFRLEMFLNEVRSLSELPMNKLIQIKSSFAAETETAGEPKLSDDVIRKPSSDMPMALPLKRTERKPIRRYEDHHHEDKGKGSKISKIFQVAITALSFVAFGGYLLTLIITAIKRNSNTTGTGSVVVLSNLQGVQKYHRPKRGAFVFDPMENDFNTERLYRGMIMLSEGYALYN